MTAPFLTIVSPIYNEAESFAAYRQRMTAVLDSLPVKGEIFLVDDHSTDQTPALVRAWASEDSRIRYIRLSRNRGSHVAYIAGLDHARGECVVLIAFDLQDPPELIGAMLEKHRSGNDIVWGKRLGGGARKPMDRITAWIANAIIYAVLPEWPENGSDFVLLDRKVVDAYRQFSEHNSSLHCTLAWMGFRQGEIEFTRSERQAGTSKWSLLKKIKLLVDVVTSFSSVPIRFASIAGIFFCLLGLIYGVYVIAYTLQGAPISGWASLMVAVLFIGGIQLLILGVFGEYLWRTFDESRKRPRYFIEHSINYDSKAQTPVLTIAARHSEH